MESYLIYFAKVNGLLILFYLMYVLFLKKETFFTSNRWYLIAGLVLSLILPLMTFTKTIWVAPAPISENNANFVPIIANQLEIPLQETAFDWSLLFNLCLPNCFDWNTIKNWNGTDFVFQQHSETN